ncbi:MAG: DUF3572 domain-containing protein [Siculibacillus sp.]|nr:DUF3572 domain-containing protein [Siculibacillus sp.]
MYTRSARTSREDAEALAVDALTFLAEDPETLGRFLGATGLGPETLRAAAGEPGFLAAVLEHLMGDETLLLVFAERRRIRPTMIAAARHTLDPVSER